MKRHTLLLLLAAILLAGCSQKRNLTHSATIKIDPNKQLMEQLIAAQPQFTTAQSKARFSINYQQHQYTLNGAINLYADSAIIISLQPLLGIELYRLEIMPSNVTLIDKLNRRYVRMTYQQVQQQTGLNVGFNDIQAICMNRMFVVGSDQTELTKQKIEVTTTDTEHQLHFSKAPLSYNYTFSRQTLQLLSTLITVAEKPYSSSVDYLNHQLWEQTVFPSQVKVSFNSTSLGGTCTISFLQLSFNGQVNVAVQDLKKYTATTLSAIIR